ncbi:ATP-binding cassette domain-containing protein [Paenibacillus piscarius]|uniref:ATP-binding cassette domain-containing protein n=1 Tax=Paenibacillus piscarius TaxID=1089681 RepID=UPI001EE798AC|nr:ATP-binding cassette domain-containing protein [Paenibacillus piscarius]
MSIQAEQISFRYTDGRLALRDISLHIPPGTLTVLCGVNGSGKSTLLRLLAGLAVPSSGQIRHDAGKSVSMVFQQPETQLFAGTVHKDIEYGLAERGVPKVQRTKIIASVLQQTGLAYDEFAARSPFLLSGGEKRRVCIAGALAVQPGLLILDEPTAGLDPQAAGALLDLVQELRGSGMTLIVGTHDLDSFLPAADQVIVMRQGTVHYDGPASILAAEPCLLAEAGLTPPAYASIGRRAVERGLLEAMPHSLEELLAGLVQHPLPLPQADGPPAIAAAPQARAGADRPAGRSLESEQPAARSGWQHLDPRVKWLGMLLGSLALLAADTLLPLLLTAGLLAVLAVSAHVSWRRAARFFRPFLVMFLFLWLLSGLSWSSPDFALGPVGFSYAGILRGGISVLRFLLLIALGFLFTETTTGAPLQEGLEWAIAPLRALGIRTRNWSLAVSVTLQFVPWILGKLAQLQLALRSRGRRTRGPGRWSPRQIVLMIVPLLILVLGMGDELATAVESRGYDPARQRTPVYQLSWSRRDTAAALCILAVAAMLWWIARIS